MRVKQCGPQQGPGVLVVGRQLAATTARALRADDQLGAADERGGARFVERHAGGGGNLGGPDLQPGLAVHGVEIAFPVRHIDPFVVNCRGGRHITFSDEDPLRPQARDVAHADVVLFALEAAVVQVLPGRRSQPLTVVIVATRRQCRCKGQQRGHQQCADVSQTRLGNAVRHALSRDDVISMPAMPNADASRCIGMRAAVTVTA